MDEAREIADEPQTAAEDAIRPSASWWRSLRVWTFVLFLCPTLAVALWIGSSAFRSATARICFNSKVKVLQKFAIQSATWDSTNGAETLLGWYIEGDNGYRMLLADELENCPTGRFYEALSRYLKKRHQAARLSLVAELDFRDKRFELTIFDAIESASEIERINGLSLFFHLEKRGYPFKALAERNRILDALEHEYQLLIDSQNYESPRRVILACLLGYSNSKFTVAQRIDAECLELSYKNLCSTKANGELSEFFCPTFEEAPKFCLPADWKLTDVRGRKLLPRFLAQRRGLNLLDELLQMSEEQRRRLPLSGKAVVYAATFGANSWDELAVVSDEIRLSRRDNLEIASVLASSNAFLWKKAGLSIGATLKGTRRRTNVKNEEAWPRQLMLIPTQFRDDLKALRTALNNENSALREVGLEKLKAVYLSQLNRKSVAACFRFDLGVRARRALATLQRADGQEVTAPEIKHIVAAALSSLDSSEAEQFLDALIFYGSYKLRTVLSNSFQTRLSPNQLQCLTRIQQCSRLVFDASFKPIAERDATFSSESFSFKIQFLADQSMDHARKYLIQCSKSSDIATFAWPKSPREHATGLSSLAKVDWNLTAKLTILDDASQKSSKSTKKLAGPKKSYISLSKAWLAVGLVRYHTGSKVQRQKLTEILRAHPFCWQFIGRIERDQHYWRDVLKSSKGVPVAYRQLAEFQLSESFQSIDVIGLSSSYIRTELAWPGVLKARPEQAVQDAVLTAVSTKAASVNFHGVDLMCGPKMQWTESQLQQIGQSLSVKQAPIYKAAHWMTRPWRIKRKSLSAIYQSVNTPQADQKALLQCASELGPFASDLTESVVKQLRRPDPEVSFYAAVTLISIANHDTAIKHICERIQTGGAGVNLTMRLLLTLRRCRTHSANGLKILAGLKFEHPGLIHAHANTKRVLQWQLDPHTSVSDTIAHFK